MVSIPHNFVQRHRTVDGGVALECLVGRSSLSPIITTATAADVVQGEHAGFKVVRVRALDGIRTWRKQTL